MNESKTEYKKWDDWKAAGLVRGMEGPYTVSGHLTLRQFVDATAGIWNALDSSGFIFDGTGTNATYCEAKPCLPESPCQHSHECYGSPPSGGAEHE